MELIYLCQHFQRSKNKVYIPSSLNTRSNAFFFSVEELLRNEKEHRCAYTEKISEIVTKRMRMLKVFGVLLWLMVSQHLATSITWVNELTKYIVDDPNYPLVNLVTNVENGDGGRSAIVEKLIGNLMRSKLCVRVNVNKTLDDIVDPGAFKVTDSSYTISATETFFVLIHDTADNSSTQKTLVDAAAKMSKFQHRPKFLLVSKVLSPSENLTALLSYAWSQKILDLTIVEFMEQELVGMRMWKRLDNATPIVHQFNPFKREYRKMKWPRNVDDLFPNKLTDLQKHKLNVAELNDKLSSLSIAQNGFESMIFAIMMKMNASPTYGMFKIPDGTTSSEDHFDWIMKNAIDISNEAIGPFTSHRNVTLRTTTVAFDSYCALVPVIYQVNTSIDMNMIAAIFLSIIIILIYLFIARVFRFNKPSWTIFYITRLFFGISVPIPTKSNQRIIFISLIIICVLYSSDIYTIITNATLKVISETPFNSFEDLDNSGLTPVVHSLSFDKIFSDDSKALLSLKNKAVTYASSGFVNEVDCIWTLIKYKNVSCFMSSKLLNQMKSLAMTEGEKVKMAEPCFFVEPRSYIVSHGSPYRWVFDQLILRFQSSGIEGSMNHLCLWNVCDNTYYLHGLEYYLTFMKKKKPLISPLTKYFMKILIVGWTLSTVAFVGEILRYHLKGASLFRFRRNKEPRK